MIGFVAVAVIIFVAAQRTDLAAHLGTIRQWVTDAGPAGYLAFIGGYTICAVLGVPGTPLTVLAGLVFGFLEGVLVMVVATTLASSLGFFIARRVARGSLERWLQEMPMYERLQSMIEREGWVAIPLARVLPVFPFAFVNYGFGLSRVPFWRYLLASELIMIPMNVVWVGVAGGVYATVAGGEMPWAILGWVTGFGLVLVAISWSIKHVAAGSQPELRHESPR